VAGYSYAGKSTTYLMPTAPPPTPAAPLSRPRLGWRREILLALLPTVTVLILLWLLKLLSNQQLLFASTLATQPTARVRCW
jgi:hypothetical protein